MVYLQSTFIFIFMFISITVININHIFSNIDSFYHFYLSVVHTCNKCYFSIIIDWVLCVNLLNINHLLTYTYIKWFIFLFSAHMTPTLEMFFENILTIKISILLIRKQDDWLMKNNYSLFYFRISTVKNNLLQYCGGGDWWWHGN